MKPEPVIRLSRKHLRFRWSDIEKALERLTDNIDEQPTETSEEE